MYVLCAEYQGAATIGQSGTRLIFVIYLEYNSNI